MSTGFAGEVQLENEHFRVTTWTVHPGGAIPMHEHSYEYVVVPLMDGVVHVVGADGTETAFEMSIGQCYSRPLGTRHRLENRGSAHLIVFVEVERLS